MDKVKLLAPALVFNALGYAGVLGVSRSFATRNAQPPSRRTDPIATFRRSTLCSRRTHRMILTGSSRWSSLQWD